MAKLVGISKALSAARKAGGCGVETTAGVVSFAEMRRRMKRRGALPRGAAQVEFRKHSGVWRVILRSEVGELLIQRKDGVQLASARVAKCRRKK